MNQIFIFGTMSGLTESEQVVSFSNLYRNETLYNVQELSSEFSFEGSNGKGIVLIYNNPAGKSVEGAEKDILNRMLSRLNSSIEKIALVNVAFNPGGTFSGIQKALNAKALIVFGIPPALLKLNIDAGLYQFVSMGKCRLLFCDDLQTIDKNSDIKKRFWAQFSPLFS